MRDSNIELLRILSAIGVLIVHINNPHGIDSLLADQAFIPQNGGGNVLFLNVLEALFCPSVNVFLLISGYFLCTNKKQVSAKKILNLLLQLIVFHVIYIVFNITYKHADFSAQRVLESLLPNDYFVSIYIALYVISPYFNIIIKALDRKGYTKFLLSIIILFSVIPTCLDIYKEIYGNNLSLNNPIGHFGSGLGQTFVQFSLMYFVGAYLRMHSLPSWLQNTKSVVCLFLLNFFILLPLIQIESIKHIDIMNRTFLAYQNPLLISEAVFLFIIFSKISLRSSLVNKLALSAFTCYIIGDVVTSKLFYWEFLKLPPLLMLGYVLTFGVVAYMISYIYYFVYSKTFSPVIDIFFKKICNNHKS